MLTDLCFCIVRYSDDDAVLRRCILSIEKQSVPHCRIMVTGNGPDSNITYVGGDQAGAGRNLGKIWNLLCSAAPSNFVVIMADYVELNSDWYAAIKDGDVLDIVGSRLSTVSGIRAVDWAYGVKLGSRTYPYPLDYDEWTTKAFVSGDLLLLRRAVWERLNFDENRPQTDRADMDFSVRAARLGFRIGVFPHAGARCFSEALPENIELTFAESSKAVQAFRKALAAGKEAFNSGDYTQALDHFSDAIRVAPDEPGALALAGWCHYFAGRYDRASSLLSQAIAGDPSNHYAFRGRGWSFLQSGDYERAIADLRQALALLNPNHRGDWLETVRGLSWAYYHSGNLPEATNFFQAALDKAESHEAGLLQDIYRGLGWSYYRQDKCAEAAACFNNAIANLNDGNQEILRDAQRGLDLARAGSSEPIAVPHSPVLIHPSLSNRQLRSKRALLRAYLSRLSGSFKRVVKSLNE